MKKHSKLHLSICALVLKIIPIALFVFFINSCKVITIEENERGVIFERFNGGINPDVIYNPGLQIFPMWNRAIIYNIDTLIREDFFHVKSADNIKHEVDINVTYKVVMDRIGYIEMYYGKEFYERIILPDIEKAFSDRISKQPSANISSMNLEAFQNELLETVSMQILKKHVELIALEITKISKVE